MPHTHKHTQNTANTAALYITPTVPHTTRTPCAQQAAQKQRQDAPSTKCPFPAISFPPGPAHQFARPAQQRRHQAASIRRHAQQHGGLLRQCAQNPSQGTTGKQDTPRVINPRPSLWQRHSSRLTAPSRPSAQQQQEWGMQQQAVTQWPHDCAHKLAASGPTRQQGITSTSPCRWSGTAQVTNQSHALCVGPSPSGPTGHSLKHTGHRPRIRLCRCLQAADNSSSSRICQLCIHTVDIVYLCLVHALDVCQDVRNAGSGVVWRLLLHRTDRQGLPLAAASTQRHPDPPAASAQATPSFQLLG